MKIALGADHAGVDLKSEVIALLQSKGIETQDFGTNTGDSVDYPDFAHPVAKMVESIKDINQIPETAPPVHLNATLRNYQAQGYSWLYFMKCLLINFKNNLVMLVFTFLRFY